MSQVYLKKTRFNAAFMLKAAIQDHLLIFKNTRTIWRHCSVYLRKEKLSKYKYNV